MRKKLIVCAIALITVLTLSSSANETMFKSVGNKIKVGNETVELKYPLYIDDGNTYISCRNLCEILGVPIQWNKEKKEVELDIYHRKVQTSEKTIYKEEGVIPDAETALIVGKAILERYAGKAMEYETEEKIYYLKVSYFEELNSWDITQTFEYKDGRGWSASGMHLPNVNLNKNTGEVMYINTYSTSLARGQ